MHRETTSTSVSSEESEELPEPFELPLAVYISDLEPLSLPELLETEVLPDFDELELLLMRELLASAVNSNETAIIQSLLESNIIPIYVSLDSPMA